MTFNYEYSKYWHDLGCVLMYRHPSFQFNKKIILTDFENCLINKLSSSKLYHAIDPTSITAYNSEFIKVLQSEYVDIGVVIISNVIGTGKLVIDSLKRKVEAFYECFQIPILGLFALKPNKLMKPHTGMWKLLKEFYLTRGYEISKACVVSDFGGRLVERELRNGSVQVKADNTDMDRAFANNLNLPYKTILEYLKSDKKEKFKWNNHCLDPSHRRIHIEKLSVYENPNIFNRLFATKADTYMLLVYGAPRTGKTTLCMSLLEKWESSTFGKTHNIIRMGTDNYSKKSRITNAKKALADYNNIIIDGGVHTNDLREPFLKLAAEYNTSILFIEVNVGINMAQIFNHVTVETANNFTTLLYDTKDYHLYNSKVTRPQNTLIYCPVINQTKQVMEYRY